jgi:hypothetical protein
MPSPATPRTGATIQYLLLGGLTVAASAVFPAAATASSLSPGEIAEGFDTTLADSPAFGGAVVTSTHIDLNFHSFPMGLYSQVVRDEQTGALSFYYRLENMSAPGETLGIDDVTIHGFRAFSTDVANLLDTAGETAAPTALRGLNGDTVTFDFDSASSRIAPGGESFTFVVKTDATHFDRTTLATIAAFPASNEEGPPTQPIETLSIPVFGPSTGVVAIPLPGAALMTAPVAALAGLYIVLKKRRLAQV